PSTSNTLASPLAALFFFSSSMRTSGNSATKQLQVNKLNAIHFFFIRFIYIAPFHFYRLTRKFTSFSVSFFLPELMDLQAFLVCRHFKKAIDFISTPREDISVT